MSETKRARKIALVGDCLAGGGAEKVQAVLSVFFALLVSCIISSN